MLIPVVKTKEPERMADIFESCGWNIDYEKTQKEGRSQIQISLFENKLLLTEVDFDWEEAEAAFLLKLPKKQFEEVFHNHRDYMVFGEIQIENCTFTMEAENDQEILFLNADKKEKVRLHHGFIEKADFCLFSNPHEGFDTWNFLGKRVQNGWEFYLLMQKQYEQLKEKESLEDFFETQKLPPGIFRKEKEVDFSEESFYLKLEDTVLLESGLQ